MKRRIGDAAQTGLGGGGPSIMDGKSTGDKKRDKLIGECAKECYELFFKGTEMDDGYCDAGVKAYEVCIGIEPSYMYERLKMITIHRDKRLSAIITGYAWGAWGTGIRQNERLYVDAKTKSKFVRFVDKWHQLLFPTT